MKYRFSNENDYDLIYSFIEEHMYKFPRVDSPIVGRFLLAFEDDQLIGAVGIQKPSRTRFNGFYIDWVVVKENYRKRGYATLLLNVLLHDVTEDVYVLAWRTSGSSRAHLHSVLLAVGFELVDERCEHYIGDFVCHEEECCKFRNNGTHIGCECQSDLYKLSRRKTNG